MNEIHTNLLISLGKNIHKSIQFTYKFTDCFLGQNKLYLNVIQFSNNFSNPAIPSPNPAGL